MENELDKTEVSAKKQRGRPFPKGVSGNPAGRPPGSADPVKEVAKRIAEARIAVKLTAKQRRQLAQMGFQESELSVLEGIMLDWATSGNVVKQDKFIERYAGKVPNVNLNTNQSIDFVTKYRSKFTDAELEAIAGGANALDILISKIPDVEEE